MNASEQIDKQISELDDWRGKTISRLRKIVHDADPDIVEEWKWGTAVFSDSGMVCAVGAFKDHVKVNFFNGARWMIRRNYSMPGWRQKLPGPSISMRRIKSMSLH